MKSKESQNKKPRRGKPVKGLTANRSTGKRQFPRRKRLELIDLADIRPDPENRTIDFTEPRHRQVQEAISNRGQLEPIVVTEHEDGGYQLLDGHLRFEAMKEEGADSVEAIIRPDPPSEKQRLADQIMLNSPSERTPFERAAAIGRLVDACDGNQAEAGELANLPRQAVNKYVALSRIDPQVRANIDRFNRVQEENDKQPLTFNHAYEIALAETESEQRRLAKLAINGATTKKLAAERKNGPPSTETNKKSEKTHKKSKTRKPSKVPLVEVALGDYKAMTVDSMEWQLASESELEQCKAVANKLGTLRPNLDDDNWPKKGIRMTWKGKVKDNGDVQFRRRNGRVYLQLREPAPTVSRKSLLISAIYLGNTQQHWD